jgi:hypothetical protein
MRFDRVGGGGNDFDDEKPKTTPTKRKPLSCKKSEPVYLTVTVCCTEDENQSLLV